MGAIDQKTWLRALAGRNLKLLTASAAVCCRSLQQEEAGVCGKWQWQSQNGQRAGKREAGTFLVVLKSS